LTEGTGKFKGGRFINMMRSMFSGVSGLRAHQTRMDVIGNNVANVNTVAFKSGRVTFQEIFSQTLRGAGAPDRTSGRGGTNPMQVGLGLGIGAIDTIMTRGSVQRTDNLTDLAIEGDGFFVVKGGGDTYKFTRAGNFTIDKLGNLVTAGGLLVYGWQDYGGKAQPDGTYKFDTEKPIQPINLYADDFNKNKRVIAAKQTSYAEFAGNLDATMPIPADLSNIQPEEKFTVPYTVYDALGNSYDIEIQFWKASADASGSRWDWRIDNKAGYTVTAGNTGTLTFGPDGRLIDGGTPATPLTITPDAIKGTSAFNVNLNFTKLSTYASDCSVKPLSVDGYTTGNLVTFTIGSDGIITGVYSNGQMQPLGLLALANFDNPSGLQKVGENLYIPTTNSGDFKKAVKPGSENVGALSPGTLEMSNVDLSREFTDMIITQRGFQANSRIITTSDEMLQELVNLKR